MHPLARLWLVPPTSATSAAGAYDFLLTHSHAAGRLRRIACAPETEARAAAQLLATRASVPIDLVAALGEPREPNPGAAFDARLRDALSRIAAQNAGAHAALVVGAVVARTVPRIALGLPAGARDRIAVEGDGLLALDWPTTDSGGARPALIGIGLDWVPPGPPAKPPRFPGGPASAPSSRG